MHVFGGLSPKVVEHELQSMALACAIEVAGRQSTAVGRSKQVLDVLEDVCNVDEEIQDLFVDMLTRRLPGIGCVGEEKSLSIPCSIPEHDVYVTIDPVDGTRNYLNGCDYGVAFMVALVVDGWVRATYVVDVFTGEVVGYGPHDALVRRWQNFDCSSEGESLHDIDHTKPLAEQPVVLRTSLQNYSPQFARLLGEDSEVFGGHTRLNGSIGLTFTHMLRGDAGAVAMRCSDKSKITPWDDTPLIGLCRLGFVSLRLNERGDGLVQYVPSPPREVRRRSHESIVVHHSQVPTLHAAYAALLG